VAVGKDRQNFTGETMSETEPKYYDGFPIREKSTETERERDLQCVNKSLIRQISEKDAEIKGINAAYEVLEKEIDNLTRSNEFLFKLLSELTIVSDKVSELNKDLKERNAKLREILVDTLKRN
jgi:chromosome segregation ATPase